MNALKKLPYFLIFCLAITTVNAQYTIEPPEGFGPNIGNMISMMEDLKNRITEQVKDLSQEETDYLFDENANTIGALIMHIAATEDYYRVETLEGRSWNRAEVEKWGGGELGDDGREKYKGKPISYYLALWDEVRAKSLKGLREKDDAWFASEVDEGFTNHYAWYHVMEHSANHMGQIALVKNRMQ